MTMSVYLSALSVTNLISRMPAAVAQGIIWGLMALGVFITFRLLDIPDMTVDGSFATGGAVTVMLLLAGMPAWAALLIAIVVGVLTGLCTGFLHTKLGIPAILAGILTQFALYSINLRIMTKANQTASVQKFGMFWENGNGFLVSSLHIPQAILVGLVLAAIIVALSYWYFSTEQGSALRATGNNPAMSRAQGIHIGTQGEIAFFFGIEQSRNIGFQIRFADFQIQGFQFLTDQRRRLELLSGNFGNAVQGMTEFRHFRQHRRNLFIQFIQRNHLSFSGANRRFSSSASCCSK